MNGGTLIESGTATITKNADGTYTLTTNLSGKSFNNSGSMTGNVDNIQYTLTNVKLPEYIDDKTQPMSTLTADVDITEPMEYFYVDPLEDAWVISGTPNRIMWRFIFSNGIEMTNDNADYETNGTLYIRGTKGSALSLQLISEAPSDMSNIAIPTGTFPMNTEYIDLYTDYSSSPDCPDHPLG